MSLSLNNVRYGGRANRTGGTLRITENGMGWKSKQGKSISVLKEKMSRLEWILVGKGKGQLRVYTTEGKSHIYDGIPSQELAGIKDTTKTFFNKDIEQVDLETKGWNWGKPSFDGSFMNFSVDGKKAFDIPLPNVEQAHLDKQEVVINFPQDNSASIEGTETLLGMIMWVPNQETDLSLPSTAESVLNSIMEKADTLSAKGKGIVTFPKVAVKTPRGRYDLEICSNFMRMKGTQSSTITYDCITRLTKLQTVDEKDRILVISLDPPLRRGHTSYPHILMQFPSEQTLSVELDLSKEQKIEYEGKLEEEMSGNSIELITQVFRVVTGIKLTKNGNFRSETEAEAVRCSLKAHDGYLYPLSKCFMFIYNPITMIPYELISHIEFARLGSTSQINRTFDLVIFMKQTKHTTDKTYIFNSINKDEHKSLQTFLRSRGISIRGTVEQVQQQQILEDEGESEDEDFESGDESVDELDYDAGDAEPIEDDPILGDDSEEISVVSEEEEEEQEEKLTKKRKRPKSSSRSKSPARKKQRV